MRRRVSCPPDHAPEYPVRGGRKRREERNKRKLAVGSGRREVFKPFCLTPLKSYIHHLSISTLSACRWSMEGRRGEGGRREGGGS